MKGCRWLVTGGAGFIGSNIVAALARRGECVRVLDDLKTGRWSNLDGLDGVERRTGDVRDPETVARACAGVEVVFHQAALCSVPESFEDPVGYDHVNVGGTVVVLDCARRNGVRRVILATSAAIYGNDPTLPKREDMPAAPLSPYAATKWIGENYLRLFASAYQLETIGLRYFNVFGPNQLPTGAYAAAIPKFVDAVLRGQAVRIFGDGEQTRDFCYIEDVVAANLMAAESPRRFRGEVLNIAGGRRISINNLVLELERALARPVHPQYSAPRPGDVRHSLADVGRADEILGWRAQVPWQQGLAPTAAFLQREIDKEVAT